MCEVWDLWEVSWPRADHSWGWVPGTRRSIKPLYLLLSEILQGKTKQSNWPSKMGLQHLNSKLLLLFHLEAVVGDCLQGVGGHREGGFPGFPWQSGELWFCHTLPVRALGEFQYTHTYPFLAQDFLRNFKSLNIQISHTLVSRAQSTIWVPHHLFIHH